MLDEHIGLILTFRVALQDRQKLLQAWVMEGENRNKCESRVVVSRESARILRGQEELLSIKAMLEDKHWPMAKVRGIISKQKGIPDEHAPDQPLLMQYWVKVSTSRTSEEASRQRSETQIDAQTPGDALLAMMPGQLGPEGSTSITQQQLQEIAGATANPIHAVAPGHAGQLVPC